MPKKIDKEKEQAFIDAFCEGDTAGNATQSAIKAGWSKDKSPRQQGAYLKKRYTKEIREKNEERITSTSGMAISVLQDLLRSEQDAVSFSGFFCNFLTLTSDSLKETVSGNLSDSATTFLIASFSSVAWVHPLNTTVAL
jgi:hypothetical protein